MPREPGALGHPSSSRGPAILASALLLFAGCVVQDPAAQAPSDPSVRWFELWITDAKGEATNLNVGFTKILLNENRLDLEESSMDLLAHRGPQEGLRIASGWIPSGSYGSVVIVFDGASAVIDGQEVDTFLPRPVLEIQQRIDFALSDGKAMLVDINVTKSLSHENGTAVVTPTAEAVYLEDLASLAEDRSAGTPVFSHALPVVQRLLADLPAPTSQETAPASVVATLPGLGEPTLVDEITEPVDGLVTAADVQGWFVQFVEGLSFQQQAGIIEAHGATPVTFFGALPGAFVWADASQAASLAGSEFVTHVELDRPVEWLLATSRTAIRLPDVSAPIIGLKDPQGNPLDGRGVGVAIIDIGIDGTHPDLPYKTLLTSDPLILANYKVESLFEIDVANTDLTSGHGTHVAGILAGRGVLDPTMKGVAPGVKVYGFGVGEASTTLWTTQALDWVAQNHDQVDPPIRIVSNSWQTSSVYDPNSLTSRLVQKLVNEGVTVLFAAGNSGNVDASGSARTSGECQHPAEGVVCVAAYDDLDTGTRAGKIASYSSRGATSKPGTWPDISAPGSKIRSTSPLLGTVTGTSLSRYTVLDGTSMATPHVSGIVALMLQADPNLTPAQVESILEATAYEFSDGGAYQPNADARYSGSHHAKGHGLADAYAAIQRALQ